MKKQITAIILIICMLYVSACQVKPTEKSDTGKTGVGSQAGTVGYATEASAGTEPTTELPPEEGTTEKDPVTEATEATEAAKAEIKAEIGVMTQEYVGENIAEILMIKHDGKNPEIDKVNDRIRSELQKPYEDHKMADDGYWMEIKSYPFTSGDYLQIVATYITFPIYGTDGDITSYNYSKKENRQITLEDAMGQHGLTAKTIEQNAKKLFKPEDPSTHIEKVVPKGFLMRGAADPYIVFLLEVDIDHPGAGDWKYFYAYEPDAASGEGKLYELDSRCLFDPSEMDKMDPPLHYGRTEAPTEAPPEKPAENKSVRFSTYSVQKKCYNDEGGWADMDFVIPRLEGDYAGIPIINGFFADKEKSFYDDYLNDVMGGAGKVEGDKDGFSKIVHYSLEAVIGSVISISGVLGGGAGGVTWGGLEGNVFLLDTGKKLGLSDIFKVGEGRYMDAIYDLVSAEIKSNIAKYGDDCGYFFDDPYSGEGHRMIRENFNKSDFYLTAGSLVVFYEKYALAFGAAGPQVFHIPFASIADILADGLISG